MILEGKINLNQNSKIFKAIFQCQTEIHISSRDTINSHGFRGTSRTSRRHNLEAEYEESGERADRLYRFGILKHISSDWHHLNK